MKVILDHALAEVSSGIQGLRAIVLSVAPDGLIAWSWTADDDPSIALGFAALDRAATVCLAELGAAEQSRSLLLTANGVWIAAWPLFEREEDTTPQRLVITTVFEGDLQSGMVMVYGTRVRTQLAAAMREARTRQASAARRALVDHLSQSTDPGSTLRSLAAELDMELQRFACIEQLDPPSLQRITAHLADSANTRPRLLQ